MFLAPATLRAAAWIAIVTASSLGIGCNQAAERPVRAATRGERFPDVKVMGLDGNSVAISEAAQGRVTVIDLWASWCEACRDQHASLNRLSGAYGDQLFVAGINVGEPSSKVRRYVETQGFDYAVFLDPDFELADALAETQLPALFVVDEQGRVIHRTSKLDRATLRLIDERLATSSPQIRSARATSSARAGKPVTLRSNTTGGATSQPVAATTEHDASRGEGSPDHQHAE